MAGSQVPIRSPYSVSIRFNAAVSHVNIHCQRGCAILKFTVISIYRSQGLCGMTQMFYLMKVRAKFLSKI